MVMGQLPPLKALIAFEAVARLLSVTRAADELGVTQSAVSQQLRTLESALGFSLFVRENLGLTLTAKGRMLEPAVRQGFKQISGCLDKIHQHNAATQVTADAAFFSAAMLPRLPDFYAKNPGRQIWFSPWLPEQTISDVNADLLLLPADHGSAVGRTIPIDLGEQLENFAATQKIDVVALTDPNLNDSLAAFIEWMIESF